MPSIATELQPSLATRHIRRAVAVLWGIGSAVAQAQTSEVLQPVTVTGKSEAAPTAAQSAPSQGSLTARTAQSVIDDAFIRDNTTPLSDYTQIVAKSPGAFSYSPNGVGLGDTKITLRGLSDSNAVYTFDGIPFNDTNGVSHHSWAYFPSQLIGGVIVDRGPGTAATIGQATFGGSIALLSRNLDEQRRLSISRSEGTWATQTTGLEFVTGAFGSDGKSNLLLNVQDLSSNGYQTYNQQKRQVYSGKFQTALNADTQLTLFADSLNLQNNTPNIKGVTRANYDAGHYNALLGNDPTRGDYYVYNFYNLATSFLYAGIAANLGDGWKLDDKLYRYQYHNKQNYANASGTISAAALPTAGTDKLNSYTTAGNVLRLTRDDPTGTLRLGLWLDRASSFRYQIPTNPRTWVDVPAPSFSETYITTTGQPFVEYEFRFGDAWKVTPGVKYASYRQDFVHLQDLGSGVGPLGGTLSRVVPGGVTCAANCVITGGAPSLANSVSYHDVLPSVDVHYQVRSNWTAYLQAAVGDQIPSTSVFDVPNARVSPEPKATKTKTVQVGTVWISDAMSLSADVYHTQLDSSYSASLDPVTQITSYYASGTQVSQGIEAEGNFALGGGFSAYLNGTLGSLKYADGPSSGQWVAGAPRDTEALGLNFQRGGWSANASVSRVGRLYNDFKSTHMAYLIEPVLLTNLFVNYSVKNPVGSARLLKVQVGVDNLLNKHSIVGIATPTAVTPSATDLLTVLPARSVNVTATLDF